MIRKTRKRTVNIPLHIDERIERERQRLDEASGGYVSHSWTDALIHFFSQDLPQLTPAAHPEESHERKEESIGSGSGSRKVARPRKQKLRPGKDGA